MNGEIKSNVYLYFDLNNLNKIKLLIFSFITVYKFVQWVIFSLSNKLYDKKEAQFKRPER